MVKYESDATKGLKMEKPAQNITVYNYFYGNSQFSLTSDIWKAIQYIVYVFRVRLKRQILFSIIYNCSCHSNTTKKFCIYSRMQPKPINFCTKTKDYRSIREYETKIWFFRRTLIGYIYLLSK